MSDIVERLRVAEKWNRGRVDEISGESMDSLADFFGEAADEIERLRSRPEPSDVEAMSLDDSLEGVIGFDIHEAIWGPLGEDEPVRPEAWKAAEAVMDILRARRALGQREEG